MILPQIFFEGQGRRGHRPSMGDKELDTWHPDLDPLDRRFVYRNMKVLPPLPATPPKVSPRNVDREREQGRERERGKGENRKNRQTALGVLGHSGRWL